MSFEAIPHPSRGRGYAIRYVGDAKPSWTPTGVFGWYRFKRDAQSRAKALTAAEKKAVQS